MSEESDDSKFSLKSSKKTFSPGNEFIGTLNVPNFFILPEYNVTEFDVKSPSFECGNATWRLNFSRFIFGKRDDRSFDVYLSKLDSKLKHPAIICTIDLLDVYGEKYDSCRNVFLLAEDDNVMDVEDDEEDEYLYIGSFKIKNSSYYRRDTLTLVIHLISGKSFKVVTDQAPLMTDSDVEILSQDFKKLFLNGKKQDLILRVSDKEFRVHQDILMARSQVFEAMLTHDMTEKNKGVIDVPDCNPQAMEQFLLYVYSGKVETLNQDNVFGLYYAADKYRMIPLKEECSKFIKQSLSVPVICKAIQLALDHTDTDLLEYATEYFVNHVNEILPTVEWMSFMKSNMIAANELFIKTTNKCDCAKSKKL